jgi:ATP-dependent DNA helicase 2 subunit 2
MPTKEAVLFVLDASITMASTYIGEDNKQDPQVKADEDISLLDASKSAVQMLMIDLMARSLTHEACVIVLKTKTTSHHLMEECEDENEVLFPNITELPLSGLTRPTGSLLRLVNEIQGTEPKQEDNDDDGEEVRGDFCDGLIVAADAIKRRTEKKKYSRRIILITDAKHRLMVDQEQVSVLLDSMLGMECQLQVIVWNVNTNPAVAVAGIKVEDDNLEEEDETRIKVQNEALLLQLATKTGGSLVSVATNAELLDAVLGGSQRKKTESVRRQCEFHVAPGMALCSTRYSLLMQKATVPSLTREAVMIDDETQLPMRNGLGEEMTLKVTSDNIHLDPDDLEVVLEDYDRTTAYRFGGDYVPIEKVELVTPSPCCIRILGYVEAAVVPRHLVVGPPYAISGANSTRDCAAISALSQGLHRLDYVAICTFVKTKDKPSILAGLFPLLETCKTTNKPIFRLVLFQLPYAGDVQHFAMPSLDEHVNTESTVCEELIDALMLGDDDLVCDRIPNPHIRLYNKTIGERAVDPSSTGVATIRSIGGNDPMSTPQHILDAAAPMVNAFYDTFLLEAVETSKSDGKNGKNRKRKGPVSARDFM